MNQATLSNKAASSISCVCCLSSCDCLRPPSLHTLKQEVRASYNQSQPLTQQTLSSIVLLSAQKRTTRTLRMRQTHREENKCWLFYLLIQWKATRRNRSAKLIPDPSREKAAHKLNIQEAQLDMNVVVYSTQCVYRDANNAHTGKQGASPPIPVAVNNLLCLIHFEPATPSVLYKGISISSQLDCCFRYWYQPRVFISVHP